MKSSSAFVIQHFHCTSMGTRFDFLTYGLDEDFFASAKTFIQNELERIEHQFSRFDEKSEIYRLNLLASKSPVQTDRETFELLSLCKQFYQKTNKLFDITVGQLTQPTPELPKREAENDDFGTPTLSEATQGIPAFSPGADKIVLDDQSLTVFFSDPAISIDLGGIGKGYALEKIRQYCISNRIHNALISFGDSSITTLGKHPHGDYWPIGIQHAFSSGQPIHSFRLNDSCLSTSGNTPNNRGKFGSKGHILNPATGIFNSDLKTVTVVTASPIEAEVISTALFIASQTDKVEIVARFNPSEAIEITYDDQLMHQITPLHYLKTS